MLIIFKLGQNVLEKHKRVYGGNKDQKQEEIEKYEEMREMRKKHVWSGDFVRGSALSTNLSLSADVY